MERPPQTKTQADVTLSLWALLQTRKLGLGEAKLPTQGHTEHVLEPESKLQTSRLPSPCCSCYPAKEGTDEKLVFPNPPSPPNPAGRERERPLSWQKGWELQDGVPHQPTRRMGLQLEQEGFG